MKLIHHLIKPAFVLLSSIIMSNNNEPKYEIKTYVNPTLVETLDPQDPLVGSIDQGTSSSRFIVFTKQGEIVASAQMEHTQIFPPGEDKVSYDIILVFVIEY